MTGSIRPKPCRPASSISESPLAAQSSSVVMLAPVTMPDVDAGCVPVAPPARSAVGPAPRAPARRSPLSGSWPAATARPLLRTARRPRRRRAAALLASHLVPASAPGRLAPAPRCARPSRRPCALGLAAVAADLARRRRAGRRTRASGRVRCRRCGGTVAGVRVPAPVLPPIRRASVATRGGDWRRRCPDGAAAGGARATVALAGGEACCSCAPPPATDARDASSAPPGVAPVTAARGASGSARRPSVTGAVAVAATTAASCSRGTSRTSVWPAECGAPGSGTAWSSA